MSVWSHTRKNVLNDVNEKFRKFYHGHMRFPWKKAYKGKSPTNLQLRELADEILKILRQDEYSKLDFSVQTESSENWKFLVWWTENKEKQFCLTFNTSRNSLIVSMNGCN